MDNWSMLYMYMHAVIEPVLTYWASPINNNFSLKNMADIEPTNVEKTIINNKRNRRWITHHTPYKN